MEPIQKQTYIYYLYLVIAIIFEVIATNSLKACESFTKLYPSIMVAVGYGLSFYFFSLCIQHLNLGIAYAFWAGFGIVLVVASSFVIFKQRLDLPAIIGVVFILVGVVVINLFSKTVVK